MAGGSVAAGMVTMLHLVRHAATAETGTRLGGHTQAPLSDDGRAQARAAAQRLADVPFAAIHTSPLPRSTQTAAILAEPHGLEPIVDDALIEVDYGDWTDRELTACRKEELWTTIQQHPSLVVFPAGESIRAAQARAVEGVEAIVAWTERLVGERADQDRPEPPAEGGEGGAKGDEALPEPVHVAAVTHADIVKALVAFYTGMHLDDFQRLAVAPASETLLALAPGVRPTLLTLNRTTEP